MLDILKSGFVGQIYLVLNQGFEGITNEQALDKVHVAKMPTILYL